MKQTIFILYLILSSVGLAQKILESETSPTFNVENPPVEERIEKISLSKKIYIITNKNASFGPGDYITIIKDDVLAARAVVAKAQNDVAGIKIIKIYSLAKWKDLAPTSVVKIIKGDDSYWAKKEEEIKEENKSAQILDDDQLFDENTIIEDEGPVIGKKTKRHIKTDNIVGIAYGRINSKDTGGNDEGYPHYSARWMYQFLDNFWAELHVGQSVIKDFPFVEDEPNNVGLSTILTNITIRAKYAIAAPWFSYVLPYVGYQIRIADSDEAGENTSSAASTNEELEQVDSLEENSLAFGVSVLKRLVPGWFITIDIGTDLISGGFALEF